MTVTCTARNGRIFWPRPKLTSLWKRRGLTLGIAAIGAGAFLALGLPLPLLLGPMLACLVAALLGARMADMG